MANDLTLGINSFVFVDDNPAEGEIIKRQIPGVAVPEVGNVENFIKILDHSGYFEVMNLSDEDVRKTEVYHVMKFNLTTFRCSENDIRHMMLDNSWITLYGKLEDKFGDNGMVTVVAGEIDRDLHIRLWLMSCTALKRGMEDAMMDVLMEKAEERRIETIYGYYYPTTKNEMVKDFYGRGRF